MSKEGNTFDLEDRLIDFAVRILRIAESLPETRNRTSSFEIPCATFDIHIPLNLCQTSQALSMT
jgi:hypothetical protein